MAGSLYLGSQKVCPVILLGGGSSETPVTIFKFADDITETPSESYRQPHVPGWCPVKIDLNNLEEVSQDNSLYYIAGGNNHISITAKKIKVISGSAAFGEAFSGSSFDEFDFGLSTIEEISGFAAFGETFYESKNLPSVIRFTNLSILSGDSALGFCFYKTNISEIYFNSLTSQSFGQKTNQFSNMVKLVTGCTVHFPSNLESVIGEWDDVLAGFGGTNTTVLFDLPATE